MKKILFLLLIFCSMLLSCSNTSPQHYFSIATLNCNLLFGFAGAGMQRELASPSEKLIDEKTYATAPMKREEVVQTKLNQLEENYKKVKNLPMDEDSKQMIEASIALYEYALPVYKNEYTALANLYDRGAPPQEIEKLENLINAKYAAKFDELYNIAINTGTAYAAKHGIEVQLVNTTPPQL